MSLTPACTVIRSFETRCGAGELLRILPTKICVVRKTRGETGPLCRHYKQDRRPAKISLFAPSSAQSSEILLAISLLPGEGCDDGLLHAAKTRKQACPPSQSIATTTSRRLSKSRRTPTDPVQGPQIGGRANQELFIASLSATPKTPF